MKKNIVTNIIAVIFIFFITYFVVDMIVEKAQSHTSEEPTNSITEPTYGDSTTPQQPQKTIYTVVYNANGENVEGTMENQEFELNEEKTLLANTFTRVGYTFEGWSTTTTGRAEYTDEQLVKNITAHPIKVELYAVWNANAYTISFDANNGSDEIKELSMTYDVEQALPANEFVNEGYTFVGWNTAADGTGNSYAENQTVKNLLASGNITLYAIWQVNEYKVVFNANNGTDNAVEQKLAYNVEASLIANTFTRTGYTFLGWSTTTTGRVEYTDEQVVKGLLTENNETLTLYAVWEANSYVIEFDANTGEGSMEALTIPYDSEKMLTTNEFIKAGHTFTGWNTASDGTGTSYTSNQVVTNLLETGSLTLYAQWKENSYTLVLNANNGSEEVVTTTLTYEQAVTLTNAFEKTGYTFEGWSTTSTGRKVYEDSQEVSKLTEEDEATVNLYAVWTANTYKVEFNGNGADGTMDEQTFTYDVVANLEANTFVRDGYTFAGWNTASDGTGTSYADKEEMINVLTSGSLTLYAKWTEHTYKVVFNSNDGSEEIKEQSFAYTEEKELEANTFTKIGYTFIGWSKTTNGNVAYTNKQKVSKLTTENGAVINLYAVWQAHTYTIEFDANGGEGEMANVARVYDDKVAIPANSFTRTGYTFTGWKLEGEDVAVGSTANLTSVDKATLTLVAQWVEHTYKVVFNSNNGLNTTKEQAFDYSVVANLQANTFERLGYTFEGWAKTTNGNVAYTNKQEVSKLTEEDKATVNLYAIWTANTYKIEYDGNGADGTMDEQTFTYDVVENLNPNTFVRTGYTFVGWNTSSDGTGTSYADKAEMNNVLTSGSLTLYAKWIEHTYTVVFNSNDGSEEIKEQSFAYTEEKDLEANTFTKIGYTFIGWSKTTNGNVAYTNKQKVSKLTTENEAVINLYAVWQAHTYTIEFDANGGEGEMANVARVYDDKVAVPANSFTRTGYTFTGWILEDTEVAVGSTDNLTTVDQATVTLYARWSINSYYVNFVFADTNIKDVRKEYEFDSIINKFEEIEQIEARLDFDKWVLASGEEFEFGGKMTAYNLVVYAVYKNQSIVKFEYNNGEAQKLIQGYVGDSINKPTNDPTRVGYDFDDWYSDKELTTKFDFALATMPEGEIVIYANWTAHTYTIEFNANGAEGTMANQERAYNDGLALPTNTFTKTGYTFTGWKSTEEANYVDGYLGNLTSVDKATITLVAQWKEHTYTLVLNANDGSYETTSTTVTYEQDVTLANEFTRTGYTFKEWNTAADGIGTSYAENAVKDHLTSVDKATFNLYAIWTANTYKVEFNGNGADGTMDEQTFTYDVVGSLNANTFTRTGYTFVGWNTSSDGTGTSYADKAEMKNVLTSGSLTLYAKWSEHSYTVVFNSNDGKELSGNQTFTYSQTKALEANEYVRVGYTFIGWSLAENGTVKYTDEATVGQLSEVNGAKVNLYAVWVAHTYTVEFNSNGGEGTMANQERAYDDGLVLPTNTFTKTGYTFIGWKSTEEVNYVDGYLGNLTSVDKATITLVAQWKEHTYTLVLNANDGSYETTSTTVTYEQDVTLANEFTRTGYTFKEWNTAADGTGTSYAENAVKDHLTSVDKATFNLYAIWTANTYKVEFNGNGADGTMDEQTFTYDVVGTLKANEFTRTGYTFVGWNTSSDGTGTSYADKAEMNNVLTSGSLTLYAKWSEHSYTVVFNNGTTVIAEQTFKYTDTKALTAKDASVVKTGYTFVGWATSANGTKAYNDGQVVGQLTDENNVEVNLYASWLEHEYKVIFHANDILASGEMLQQEFTYEEAKALLANEFTKDGYHFVGWSISENSKVVTHIDQKIVKQLSAEQNGIVNLYAIWEENTYILELYANHDNPTSSTRQTVHYTDSVVLTHEYTYKGHDFVGWALTPSGAKVYEPNAVVSMLTTVNEEEFCLYAKWVAHEYTIIFHANDEDAEGTMSNQDFTYDEEKSLLENEYVKAGYSFVGWATSENGTVVYTDQKIVSKLTAEQNGIINLYAVWSENSYTLELHANDGTEKSHIITLKYGDTYVLESLFMRVGYTFSGWSSEASGEVEYNIGESVSMLVESGIVNLYAIWNEIDRRDVIFTINNSIEEITLERKNNTYFAQDVLLEGELTFTIINYITDRMYQCEATVSKKGYYDVTFNLTALTVECVYTFEYIDVGEYNELPDSVEGVDVSDLTELKNVFDSINSSYTIETQTYFNPAAIRIINKIYETDYKQHNINTITVDQDDETKFTLFDVDSDYVDEYGPTTVKYSSSYSVDYDGWTRIGENKYKCDRTEVVEHFRELLTPGLSNSGTYMTYKYITVQINSDGSLTIRLYCSTTQSGKVIKEHKDQVNNPQWYMLLAEGTITDFE